VLDRFHDGQHTGDGGLVLDSMAFGVSGLGAFIDDEAEACTGNVVRDEVRTEH
jgi:hypothetical protein